MSNLLYEMAITDTDIQDTELQRIERWREEALGRAGYDAPAAKALATRLDVDLHRAVALLERGCSQELALRILL